MSFSSVLLLVHLIGLALGVGGATVKLLLLLRCRADPTLLPVYWRVTRPITRQIIAGMVLLTLSGIGFVWTGYTFTPLLIVKVILVGAIWVLGPVIDNVTEPRFQKLAPAPGEAPSMAFARAQGHHLALEVLATTLFYVTIVIWVRG